MVRETPETSEKTVNRAQGIPAISIFLAVSARLSRSAVALQWYNAPSGTTPTTAAREPRTITFSWLWTPPTHCAR
eukprot:514424-Prymnesium_polylepis.1